MANNNAPISEEIVAAISAAVEMMTGKKVMAVRIKRSDAWTMAGRRDNA
ncbi:MAG TPA: hypothetical protein K8V65_08880 [Megamonas hypermegale]|uniref:Methylmalonyl-CoA carboxyltransferase 12S subunit n=1 Tax=Megamonas hypermegale TaxID=158847 RepID=A0A921HNR1_9FIRM|nr:hypothetical protein [Megamonas hypermegale]MDM8143619.1 hypothetical protein [Megamonas hypermegale]HJF85760.1 hypothetical protein [Megamonas hypermegale]